MNKVSYVFIVDTENYAGNFERELCGYITGHWDNETHGGDQADVFIKEVEIPHIFEDYIGFILIENSLQTPVDIKQTPGKENSKDKYCSVGIFFEKRPTEEMIQLMKDRSYKFEKEGLIFNKPVDIKVTGFRLETQTTTITEEKV